MKIFSYKTAVIIGIMIILSQIGTSATSITSQGIITTGNMTADNVFLAADMFAHDNKTVAIGSINVWENITFDHEASLGARITHNFNDGTNHTFTVTDAGKYKIQYFINFEDSAANPSSHTAVRIMNNDVEIDGSSKEGDPSKQNAEIELSNTVHIILAASDVITFQWVADTSTVSLMTHSTFGNNPEAATITMARIS